MTYSQLDSKQNGNDDETNYECYLAAHIPVTSSVLVVT